MNRILKKIGLFVVAVFICGQVSAQWSTSGNYVYLSSAGDSVGIGTSSPNYSLHVRGTGKKTFEVESTNHAVEWSLNNKNRPLTIRFRRNGATKSSIQMPANTEELRFQTGGANDRMTIDANGNIGIGTTAPQSILSVNGKITCKEVEVTLTGFPDYVFMSDYKLMSLPEVEAYITENGHLPNMPSEQEVIENGIGLGELNVILVEKIEELTLHTIEQDKKIKELTEMLEKLVQQDN